MDQKRGAANKTALITGASGGIGLEFARLFARDGYDLLLVARSADKLAQIKGELEKNHGVSVKVITKDLSDPKSPEEIYAELQEEGTRVDALVNNAGYTMFDPFIKTDKDEELRMIQVNVVTLTHMTKLFLPGMVERGRGRILNVASTASFLPGPLMAVYYATKAYVLSFSEAIAEELRGTGVTVTTLAPGPTATGFQKRANMEDSRLVSGKRIMSARVVAEAGYKAMMQGKRLEVPGLGNKLVAISPRFTPRRFMPGIVKRLQERTGEH